MIERFAQLILRINARNARITAVVILVAAGLHAAVSEAMREGKTYTIETYGKETFNDAVTPFSWPDFKIEAAQENPFVSPYLQDLIAQLQEPDEQPTSPAPTPGPEDDPEEDDPMPERTLRLSFKGALMRTDGTILALISDLDAGWERAVRKGDMVEGLQVRKIELNRLYLEDEQHSFQLGAGEEQVLEIR